MDTEPTIEDVVQHWNEFQAVLRESTPTMRAFMLRTRTWTSMEMAAAMKKIVELQKTQGMVWG